MAHSHAGASSLTRWAWLSVGAAVLTIGMKTAAYAVTGSVGLLSDALESMVNLVAAIVALIALTIAHRPADRTHHYGHGKAEYFSAGAEGLMILVAAGLIFYSAIARLLNPQPLEELGIGLAITIAATAVNGIVGLLLIRQGKRHRSITLVADGRHLMTDVYTSVGVVVGVLLVGLTGWLPLDSLVAIAVGINILWTGAVLMRNAGRGLMDHALPEDEQDAIVEVLGAIARKYPPGEVEFHGLQTREAGRQQFVSVHVLVPGDWTVQRGHDVVEEVEEAIRGVLHEGTVHTHLESMEDPRSHSDYDRGPRITHGDPPAR